MPVRTHDVSISIALYSYITLTDNQQAAEFVLWYEQKLN